MNCKHYARRPHATPHITYNVGDLCAAYKFPKLSVNNDAEIGIIELGGGYKPSDIVKAFAKWNLPVPSITDVSVDGGKNTPGDDADAEVLLDIQVATAAYSYCTGRAAKLRMYFAPNTDAGFANAVKKATADGCAVISISWGQAEDGWGSSVTAFSSVCAAAKAAGVTIFAASGDNDSGDGEKGKHVDYPASDPNVIGCGGTTKTGASESVWNDGQNGTGGGFSVLFKRPAWQTTKNAQRSVPDVAANADPQTGYNIVINGSWSVIGGTSAVAPLAAGLMAALKSAGFGLKADLSTAFWSNPQAFTDIVSGNNGAFKATVGPDECTGLGVFNGELLAGIFGSVPPPPPPPPIPPVLGTIVIDLDAKTVTLPNGFVTKG